MWMMYEDGEAKIHIAMTFVNISGLFQLMNVKNFLSMSRLSENIIFLGEHTVIISKMPAGGQNKCLFQF